MAMVFSQEEFEAWALADLGMAADSVYYYGGRLRACIREGFDVDVFLSSPEAALHERRKLIAKLKRQLDETGRPTPANTLRGYDRVINWLSSYAEARNPDRVWPHFKLTKEPKTEPKTVSRENMERLWAYGSDANYDDLLVRCLSWVAYWLGQRRREVVSEELPDLKEASSEVWTRYVGKGGVYHDIQVPRVFWHEDKPLKRFLAVRVEVSGSEKIFTRLHGSTGKPIDVTPAYAYKLLKAAGDELGFQVNFTRTRRSISMYEKQCGVKTETTQHQRGHVSIKNTEEYTGRGTAADARADLIANVPEYRSEAAQEARQA